MDKQAVKRRVRIAVSVFFAVLTVAIVVLWVRSYSVIDAVSGTRGPHFYYAGACKGEFGLSSIVPVTKQQIPWDLFTEPIESRHSLFSEGPGYRIIRTPGTRVAHFGNGWHLVISFWVPIFLSSVLAAAVWSPVRPKFSLRTMLIATTLFAVVLGLVGYTVR